MGVIIAVCDVARIGPDSVSISACDSVGVSVGVATALWPSSLFSRLLGSCGWMG